MVRPLHTLTGVILLDARTRGETLANTTVDASSLPKGGWSEVTLEFVNDAVSTDLELRGILLSGYTDKVRTEMVKRISLELLDMYPYSFQPEFEPNKQFLKEIGLDVSKKLRNRIAGYVTTVVKSDLLAEAQEAAEEALGEIQ